jgi:hypothetical protein
MGDSLSKTGRLSTDIGESIDFNETQFLEAHWRTENCKSNYPDSEAYRDCVHCPTAYGAVFICNSRKKKFLIELSGKED